MNDFQGEITTENFTLDQILSYTQHYAWCKRVILQDYQGNHLWSGGLSMAAMLDWGTTYGSHT